jgi:DNA-binding transcriptional ArsR family regulator
MITLRLGADALARVRFAISPLHEALRSLLALDDPSAQPLHLPWVVRARQDTADLDLSVLRALQPRGLYSPDFINPPPTSPLAEFDDELARMKATPSEQVRAEIQRTYAGRPLPESLEDFVSSPEDAIDGLARLLAEYWERTLAAHWPRIRAMLEGDVLYRARQMADGGAQQLFGDLDPIVSWEDGVLAVNKAAEGDLELDERGLLLVPSVFTWPTVSAVMDPAWQPALIYTARGVGMLWEPPRVPTPEALADLLGRRRAAILVSLDQPRSTAELARRLEFPDSSVSQHLGVLARSGLVSSRRVGRVVLYIRSVRGEALVEPAATT